MKTYSLCGIISLALLSVATSEQAGGARCVNVWDEGCINDQLQGAGRDDDFVSGDFSPGKRCADAWGRGCGDEDARHGGADNEKLSEKYAAARLYYRLLARLRHGARAQ